MGKRKRQKRGPSSRKPPPAKRRKAKAGAPKAKRKRAKTKRASLHCPACGGAGMRSGAPGRARCRACGVLFPRKMPTLLELMKTREARFTGHSRWSYLDDKGRAEAHAEEAMRGFFRIRTGKPAALNAFGRCVLEVNCGYGNMLGAFKRYGWTVAGTETNPAALNRAHQDLLDVKRERFVAARFGRTRFDLVVFRASFGEIADLHKAVEKLHDVLKPDGLVCVLRESLAGEGAEPPADAARLFLHTAESLKRVFTRNGFTAVSEEVADGVGTFWFKVKPRRGK